MNLQYSQGILQTSYLSLVVISMIILFLPQASSQQTILQSDARNEFFAIVKDYEQGLFGRCHRAAKRYIHRYKEHNFDELVLEAELYKLKAGLRLDNPGILNTILAFAEHHKPEASSDQAILLLGDHAYAQKDYDEAIEYFGMVDGRALSPEEMSAFNFKLGYVLFIRKEFDRAELYFNRNREVRDKYYYPSNYYYGMTQYFREDYSGAVKSFERVATSSFYKDYIPYYIVQIYFSTDRVF